MSLLDQPAYADHLRELDKRWQQALTSGRFDCAVVTAGAGQNYFMDDQAPPFRPNPHFAQFFPERNSEHCELIVRPGNKPTLLFYQPEDYWHLPPTVPDWAAHHFALEQHSTLESLQQARADHLQGQNNVALIGPKPTVDAAQHNPAGLLSHLDYLRNQKTPFEVAAIRQATEHTVAGHIAAREAFARGDSEYRIYMQFLAATGNTGGELPYSSIVALNEHAGVLHYQHYDHSVPAAHLSFLIDAGASHLGYASDVTRTYASPAAPAEFAALIASLDTLQLELINGIHEGQSYASLHGDMIDAIAGLLATSGILTCSADEAITRKLADPFMPHGLGHLIGLQTHDVGGQIANIDGDPAPPDERFPALRLTRPIELNSVFTIEPGIYFIPMLLDPLRNTDAPVNWQLIDALLPCGGIRIEDNVWLSKDGPVNLTRELFAAAD